MGFTGEFVRSVFSRNRSTDHHHHHHPQNKVRSNNNGVEKRRWVSVKSYLCGDHDELDSVLAAEDSASVNRSEETVMQPIQEDWLSREETKSEEETVTENNDRKNSNFKLLSEEEAAILIQAAYRGFLCRRQNEGIRKKITGEDEEEKNLVMASPDTKSMGSSIEVQTGNSIEVYPLEGEKISVYHHRSQHRARAQVLKQKDDWDDSTVSSYVSKMRMQNRMEATTRRERALAYAFSQQLRICSKRTPNKYNSNAEPNMSWSWLERWMATRLPDSASVESHDYRFAVRKRFLDVACREEKESCGSNEVSLHQFDKCSSTSQEVVVKDHDHDFINPPAATKAKNNLKARTRRTVSRRKTVPSYQFPEAHFKVSKREGSSTVRKDNRQKEKQMGFKRIEMKPNSPMKS
ncbi:protein IQ-DOMAIN 33 isoform X2 [Prosopis cineraria]|uniref:protein IQ-DOMAIN 33 isoform X2 n=1 Tax=Prosopis cineraria TaxID=364024 RepID=UPI00240F0B0F|nr:protein IQ-DOMAIN 33 isoform X2 [Prosopis cineraria]